MIIEWTDKNGTPRTSQRYAMFTYLGEKYIVVMGVDFEVLVEGDFTVQGGKGIVKRPAKRNRLK